MDIYRFVNSKDIRKHLKDINYEFNALEAAWLVYQCKDATLEERHNAWTWIINNMPDMEVHSSFHSMHKDSIHDALRAYMAMNNDLIGQFESSEEGVYTYDHYYGGRSSSRCWSDEEVFYSFEDCINSIKEELKSDEENDEKLNEYISNSWYGNAIVAVRYFKDKDYKIEVAYGPGCTIRCVYVLGEGYRKEYDELQYDFMEKKNATIKPIVGAYYRNLPRGNYNKDNILCLYGGIRF